MTRFVSALALAAFVAASPAAQAPVRQAALDRIDRMAAAEHAKDGVGSLTVGVVSGDALVWTRSYGLADMERKAPATRATVYRIGSITKQFTALMLLQLVRDGRVHLSDPVEKFLPEVNRLQGRPVHAPPITLAQLATMTSGVAREPANLPTFLVGPVARWEEVLLAALAQTSYAHEPDTRYLYSNIGYGILGAALGRAAGVPYTEYVEQRIFVPLGMSQTAFEPTPGIQAQLARGYEIGRDGKVSADAPAREHAGRGYKVPNGAMYTTVDDLARFVSFELGGGPESVLGRQARDDNFSRVSSADGALDSGYGVGFQLARRGDLVFLGHGGSVAGYTAQAWVHRASRTGVVLLRSAGGGAFDLPGLTFRALAELARP